jgi:hypothetical protein
VLAFVLHHHHSPIDKLTDEVRIEPIARCLEAEWTLIAEQGCEPEPDARQPVDELRARELFGTFPPA